MELIPGQHDLQIWQRLQEAESPADGRVIGAVFSKNGFGFGTERSEAPPRQDSIDNTGRPCFVITSYLILHPAGPVKIV